MAQFLIDEYKRLNANEAAIKNLDAKFSEIRLKQSQAALSEKQIVKIVAAYKQKITKKNPDDVRALLNTFLDSVVVHKDRVEVNLRISVGLTGAEGSDVAEPTNNRMFRVKSSAPRHKSVIHASDALISTEII